MYITYSMTARRWRVRIATAITTTIAATVIAAVPAAAYAPVPACDESAWVYGHTTVGGSATVESLYDMPARVYGGGSIEWRCNIRFGTTSGSVRRLQTTLNQCHLHTTGVMLSMDGQFGTRTRDAMIRVQRAYRITADGVYGPQTAATIAQAVYPLQFSNGWTCAPFHP